MGLGTAEDDGSGQDNRALMLPAGDVQGVVRALEWELQRWSVSTTA